MRILVPGLVLTLAFLAGPAVAGDDAATTEAKAKIEYFDAHARVKDNGKYADLLMDLTLLRHELTVERVARVLLKDPDEEHKLIAAATLAAFTKPEAVKNIAGKALVKAIESGMDVEITDTAVDSIGKLKYREGVMTLVDVLKKGGDPWLLVTTVRVCGILEDWRALPQLLELWERYPVGDSWEGGEVTVDTGTAGDGDQQAAEAKYNSEHQGEGRKGKPPVMLRAYIRELVKSIKKITKDESIRKPDDLRAWMQAHIDELTKLGISIPKAKPQPKKDGKDAKDGDEKKGDKK